MMLPIISFWIIFSVYEREMQETQYGRCECEEINLVLRIVSRKSSAFCFPGELDCVDGSFHFC